MTVDLTTPPDSDSDSDIFTNCSVLKPLSMYADAPCSATVHVLSSSGDDDADLDAFSARGRASTRRGGSRTRKRRRLPEAAGGRQGKGRVGGKLAGEEEKGGRRRKGAATVFDESSEGEGAEVEEVVEEITPGRRDSLDVTAAAQLAEARRLLAGGGDEVVIARQAELEAKMMAAAAEEKAAEEKRREAEEKERAAKEAGERSRPIMLKVRGGGAQLKMRIRRTDKVLRMLKPFCDKFGLEAEKAIMEADGEDVVDADTPLSLDLEDNMIIDVRFR